MTDPKRTRPVWTEAERRAAALKAKSNLSNNRDHLDPVLTRKGILAHPGSLFLVASALFFFAYVFNLGGIQPVLDDFFGNLNRSAQSQNSVVSETLVSSVPYIEIGLGVIAAWVAFMLLRRAFKSGSKAAKLSARKPLTAQEFIDLAAANQISAKVAREAYDLLLPHYSNRMRTRLTDSLGGDLQLSKHDRADLVGNLLRRTDRLSQWETKEEDIDTVFDLLTTAESAKPRFLPQAERRPRTI